MDMVAMFLTLFGAMLMVVGGLWFLVAAFSENVLWGLGCIFVPVVSLIFLIMHWNKAGIAFAIQMVGLALALGGAYVKQGSAGY